MASGCILGECPYCSELIWEDEIFLFSRYERIAHLKCENEHREQDKIVLALKHSLKAAERKIKELEAELKARG